MISRFVSSLETAAQFPRPALNRLPPPARLLIPRPTISKPAPAALWGPQYHRLTSRRPSPRAFGPTVPQTPREEKAQPPSRRVKKDARPRRGRGRRSRDVIGRPARGRRAGNLAFGLGQSQGGDRSRSRVRRGVEVSCLCGLGLAAGEPGVYFGGLSVHGGA